MQLPNRKLLDRLGLWQRRLRVLSSLVPARKLPLLTPAEAYGPDLERFRDSAQALVAWLDKQSQIWSFRGVLATERGRKLGFQLTFIDRHTQNDFVGAVPMRWITPRAFAAHFALSDPMNADAEATFRYWQRGSLVTAGGGFAADDRFHVEIGGWYAFRRDDGSISVFASGAGDSVHLELAAAPRPLVFHGQSGFAQKDPREAATSAAYYCSQPRLSTTGRILLDGRLETVTGHTWLDHEKLTMSQSPYASRWDRIELQLDSGHDLMLWLSEEQLGSGSWIEPDGKVTHLISSDLNVSTVEYWTSPKTGARYPIKRKIRIEPLDVELDVRAALPEQELDTIRTTFSSHWEGLISASGRLKTSGLTGQGFMQLVGYDTRPAVKAFQFLTGA